MPETNKLLVYKYLNIPLLPRNPSLLNCTSHILILLDSKKKSEIAMPNVVLILGGGANIGAAVSQGFSAKGYKVASTSRTDNASNAGKNGIDLHITGDLSNSESVAHIFGQVVSKLGHPRVVIYNGASFIEHLVWKHKKIRLIQANSFCIYSPFP